MRFHFVLDPRATCWPDLERLDERDIDAAPERFVGGRNSWIAQTFVRLREALASRGWEATTGPAFAPGAINIAHRDDANRFSGGAAASFLVVVRADRAPVHACDLAIAQNPLDLDAHERYLPLWPQPGLLPRASARGTRLECLAYLGRPGSLPAWLVEGDFLHALRRRGVRFELRTRGWNDYRGVDAVIATREESSRMLATKPATKLYNGWIAGAPVLAAPEPAYRALRRGSLDFLEVDGAAQVLQAVDRLRAEPSLYSAMVRNGRERGASFDVAATRDRWLDLIERDIVPRFHHTRERLPHRKAWFALALARQRAASRWHKAVIALERAGRAGAAGAWTLPPPVSGKASHLSVAKGLLPVK